MAKKRTEQTEIPIDEPIVETFEATPQSEPSVSGDVEKEFADMEKQNSEMSADEGELPPTEGEPRTITPADKMKIRIFLGFFLYIVGAANIFLLNYIKGYKVPMSGIAFDDADKDSLMPYLENEEVLKIIDTIPPYVWAFCHIEFMIIQKYNAICVNFPIPETPKEEKK